MSHNLLRHESRDDTWAWLVAFIFSILATLATTTYLVSIIINYFWQWFASDYVPSSALMVPWAVFLAVTALVAWAAFVYWLQAAIVRRREPVPELLRRIGARQVGGEVDPRIKRLANINEEIAIASGIAAPTICLIEGEPAINAFTTGTTVDDVTICVTGGALRTLKRAELQAVVAHEYGHILNGDVRRNTRLLLLLDLMQPYDQKAPMSRFWVYMRNLVLFAVILLPLALINENFAELAGVALLIAAVSTFFWSLSKMVTLWWKLGASMTRAARSAVSRRSELRADALSAQLTRDPESLASALRKIAGLGAGLHISSDDAQAIEHMCIASALSGKQAGLFALHPTIEARLRQLGFPLQGDESGVFSGRSESYDACVADVDTELAQELGAVFAGGSASNTTPDMNSGDLPSEGTKPGWVKLPDVLEATPDLVQASRLLGGISRNLRVAVRTSAGARAAAYSLIGSQPPCRDDAVAILYNELAAMLTSLGEGHRLPLFELAAPALRSLDTEQKTELLGGLRTAILADARVTFRELVFFTLLAKQLQIAPGKPGRSHPGDAFALVLGVAARASTTSEAAAEVAFEAGRDAGFPRAKTLPSREGLTLEAMDEALRALELLPLPRRRTVVAALARAVSRDGKISTPELEFLRAIAAGIRVPVAPITRRHG